METSQGPTAVAGNISNNGTVGHPSGTREGPYLLHSILPSSNSISFTQTTFFANGNSRLPSTAEVRLAGREATRNRPRPVVVHSLNLVVKYGLAINVAEAQCLWAIRRLVPTLPVPELYAWCQDDGQTFIYMQLVEGITLEGGWPDLDIEEKKNICVELRHMLGDLRQLRQDPTAPFIDTNRGPLHDVIFDVRQPAGPFADVTSFHEWFANLTRRTACDPNEAPHPWRSGLVDDVPIVFTHGDLHRSNIMMCRDANGDPHVAGIIDWHESGWCPATWEFYKIRWTCRVKEKWEIDFILEFLWLYPGYISWDCFVLALGV